MLRPHTYTPYISSISNLQKFIGFSASPDVCVYSAPAVMSHLSVYLTLSLAVSLDLWLKIWPHPNVSIKIHHQVFCWCCCLLACYRIEAPARTHPHSCDVNCFFVSFILFRLNGGEKIQYSFFPGMQIFFCMQNWNKMKSKLEFEDRKKTIGCEFKWNHKSDGVSATRTTRVYQSCSLRYFFRHTLVVDFFF